MIKRILLGKTYTLAGMEVTVQKVKKGIWFYNNFAWRQEDEVHYTSLQDGKTLMLTSRASDFRKNAVLNAKC
ncbi:MAG TPA: hypothetical protein VII94_03455 [Candidatus Saccharimonadales bacterium]